MKNDNSFIGGILDTIYTTQFLLIEVRSYRREIFLFIGYIKAIHLRPLALQIGE
jgi:hypothetical protein